MAATFKILPFEKQMITVRKDGAIGRAAVLVEDLGVIDARRDDVLGLADGYVTLSDDFVAQQREHIARREQMDRGQAERTAREAAERRAEWDEDFATMAADDLKPVLRAIAVAIPDYLAASNAADRALDEAMQAAGIKFDHSARAFVRI